MVRPRKKVSVSNHSLNLEETARSRLFLYRRSFTAFLRNSGTAESYLAGWTCDETNLDRLIPAVCQQDAGGAILTRMVNNLLERTVSPIGSDFGK